MSLSFYGYLGMSGLRRRGQDFRAYPRERSPSVQVGALVRFILAETSGARCQAQVMRVAQSGEAFSALQPGCRQNIKTCFCSL